MLNLFSPQRWMSMLLAFPGIITAISFHEMAHGLAAESMGDNTAALQGRLSLNPFRHLSLLGTLSMLFLGFGWAKPVPVNPNNFRNRKMGIILVSLAGCLTNLLLGFISLAIYYLCAPLNNSLLETILYYMAFYNVLFAVFNLIPIPPLDGSQILEVFLPYNAQRFMQQYSNYGSIILLILIFTGVFSYIITPATSAILHLYQLILTPLINLV